jgi:hypothetical protein
MMTSMPRGLHHGRGPDAGVDADDQCHAHGRRALDHVGAHAVAVPQAMWNVKAGLAPGHLDGSLQNDDGYGPVHVVIAVDQDFLLGSNGRQQALNGVVHAGQQRRVEQVLEGGSQKPARGRSIGDPAAQQHGSGEGLHAQVHGQRSGGIRIRGGNQPAGT